MVLKSRLKKLEEKIEPIKNKKKYKKNGFLDDMMDDIAYEIITGEKPPLSAEEKRKEEEYKQSELCKAFEEYLNSKTEEEWEQEAKDFQESDWWQSIKKEAEKRAKNPDFLDNYKKEYWEKFI